MRLALLLACLLGVGDAWLGFSWRSEAAAEPSALRLQRRTPTAVHFPEHEDLGGESGQPPALLSPLVRQGRIEEAQAMAETLILDIKGYSGWLSVNESCGSAIYFWYFPPTKLQGRAKEQAPLLMWLQGGPGGSSMFGLFEELGPYKVVQAGPKAFNALQRQIGAWTDDYGVIFVDNPVGTGFSYTEKGCYAATQEDVAGDLYAFLQQFYRLFPALQSAPFYPTGESYAGKYVPAIAYRIHVENAKPSKGKIRIPLAGLAVGDGFSAPVRMMSEYAPLLYYAGLLDEAERDAMRDAFARAEALYHSGALLQAFQVFDEALNGDITPYPSLFTNATGGTNYFNILRTNNAPSVYQFWLNDPKIRRLMHTGDKVYHNGSVVEQHMLSDFLKPVTDWITALLDNDYKVLFYNGNLDVIVGTTLTERMLWTLPWKGASKYKRAKKSIWKVSPSDAEVAGYVRRAGNLWQVAVRNGGHMLPRDQPRATQDLIRRFVGGRL